MVTKGSSFSPEVWQAGAVLLVDKPPGWTSFDVCGKLRGALRVKKVRGVKRHLWVLLCGWQPLGHDGVDVHTRCKSALPIMHA